MTKGVATSPYGSKSMGPVAPTYQMFLPALIAFLIYLGAFQMIVRLYFWAQTLSLANTELGVFGFGAIKDADGNIRTNLGFLDQRQGLRWTKENTGAFGGDPDLVTIFGV